MAKRSDTRRKRARTMSGAAASKQGLPPGTAVYTGEPRNVEVSVRLMQYDGEHADDKLVEELAQAFPLPSAVVSWIDVDGLHDVRTIQDLASVLKIHPLVVEDALNVDSPPKLDDFRDHLQVGLKMVALKVDEDGITRVELEHLTVVLGSSWVLTLQERPGDVFDSLRARIRAGTGRARRTGADYLAYALMDVVVDGYFGVLQHFEEAALLLEEAALEGELPDAPREIHRLKAELLVLRRALWPMRDALSELASTEHELVQPTTVPYLRDLLDHVRQASDIVDTSRDRLGGVLDLYLAVSGHRLNEVMKVLTIVATVFIPLTFIAGIYGMNFDDMPELHHPWGYPLVLLSMLGITIAMGAWFRRRGWI